MANRLTSVDGQSYTFDDNGNLLNTGVMTNTFDPANRLIESERDGFVLEPHYNGIGDRVAQTTAVTTTYYALDVVGLPEVIYTSEGNNYLHLPGVIMAESAEGEVRYLLSDGLGSIRQAIDETGDIVSSDEFDPYGNPLTQHATRTTPYAYTGEWWQEEVGLLHLRARWYLAETGVFVSRDPVEGEPAYLYARGNPVNQVDPSGMTPATSQPPNSAATIMEAPSGYVEGFAYSLTVGGCIQIIQGGEVVYDFNTGERMKFTYTDSPLPIIENGFALAYLDGSGAVYAGYIWGFKRNFVGNRAGIIDEYKGGALSFSAGSSLPPTPEGPWSIISINFGATLFASETVLQSPSDYYPKGVAFYVGVGAGISPIAPGNISFASAFYTPESFVQSPPYRTAEEMANDILNGVDAPLLINTTILPILREPAAQIVRELAPDHEWGIPVSPPPATPEPETCRGVKCYIEFIPRTPIPPTPTPIPTPTPTPNPNPIVCFGGTICVQRR